MMGKGYTTVRVPVSTDIVLSDKNLPIVLLAIPEEQRRGARGFSLVGIESDDNNKGLQTAVVRIER